MAICTDSKAIASLPWEITDSGTYHLEQDLVGPPGEYSLRISAPAVTIDFRGNSLSSQADVAILLNAAEFSLKNGKLLAHQSALVPEPHLRADHCVLENLEVEGGLFIGGQSLIANDCSVRGGAFGIKAGEQARLTRCSIHECLLGIEVAAGSVIEDCLVKNCEEGAYAFGSREFPCHLERVVVYESDGLGLRLDGPGTLYRCEAHHNGRSEPSGGILAGPAAVVKECEAYGNAGGDIAVVEPCELIDNRTSDGSGNP